jgi:hypothetical protein
MRRKDLEKLYQEYCTIKTMALTGNRITRKDAMRALKIKKILNKENFFKKEKEK